MKKTLFLFCLLFFLLCTTGYLSAQKTGQDRLDSLLAELPKAKEDTNTVKLMADIISGYASINPEEGLKYEHPALNLAEKINWKPGIASIKRKSGRLYYRLGNYEEALKRHIEALSISEQLKDTFHIVVTLTFIGQDYADNGNYPQALAYFSKSLKIAEASGELKSQAYAHSLLSWIYTNLSNLPEATKSNLASLKIYEQLDDLHGIAVATSNIAGYYREMGNYVEARKYYEKSIGAFKAIGDNLNLASLYIDFGRMDEATGNPAEALQYFNLSLQLGRQVHDRFTIAFAQQNIGDWQKNQGNCSEALKYYQTAAEAYRIISNKQVLADLLLSAGSCYTRLNKYKEANDYFREALTLSNEVGSPSLLSAYYGSREILDSTLGHWKDAYFHYKLHIQKRDSINSDETNKKSLQLNMQYEFDKKEAAAKAEQDKKDALAQKKLQKQRLVRNGFIGGFAFVLVFAGVFFTQRNKIRKGKQLSDELLLNILPSEVAEELKEKGSAEAKHFDEVTVMFTDFKGFTQISEKLSPTELVNEIHTCFKAFDDIISKHNIEKIKTIGDSYMCAGGLPVANTTNATDVVNAAMEIQKFMEQHLQERKSGGKEIFEMRIGIHTGPVVAGIVGVKKFAYDIWGDTVNIAARMESSGETGKINISGSTYALVKDSFTCIHRGKVQAKNKGEIDMYFVERKEDGNPPDRMAN